jgi:hypothetical protein
VSLNLSQKRQVTNIDEYTPIGRGTSVNKIKNTEAIFRHDERGNSEESQSSLDLIVCKKGYAFAIF